MGMTVRNLPDTVPVVHRVKGILRPTWVMLDAGCTIEDVVRSVPGLSIDFWRRGVVTLDRKDGRGSTEVPRRMWRYVRPKGGGLVEVNLYLPPEGDNVKSIVSIVATIAVIVAAAVVSGPLGVGFFAGLGLSAGLATAAAATAGAAVAILGSLAIRALSPPPSTSTLSNSDVGTPFQPASISGNQLRPGAIIPHVRGTRKIFPPIVVKPRVELVDNDEYAYAVFGLAGAHTLTDIRADGVPIADMDEVEYEVREGHLGDSRLTLVDGQSFTDGSVVTLSQHQLDVTNTDRIKDQSSASALLDNSPHWHRFRVDGEPDEVQLTLKWPTGLFDADDATLQMVTHLRMRMREVGDTDWIGFPEIGFAYKRQEPFQKDVRIKWGTAPAAPTPKLDRAPYAAYAAVTMRHADQGNTQVGDFNSGTWSTTNDTSTASGVGKTGTTASMYVGFLAPNFPRRAVKLIARSGGTGFSGAANVTIEYYGKSTAGAPANSTDGTLLATTGSIADSNNLVVELNSSDTSTLFYSQWFRVVGGTSSDYGVQELQFYDDGEWSWLSHSSFYTSLTGVVTNYVMRNTTIGTTVVRNTLLYEDRVEFYVDPLTIPKGDYEIEIIRSTVVDQAQFEETTYIDNDDVLRVAELFKFRWDGSNWVVPRGMSNVQYQMQKVRICSIWNEYPLPDAPGKLALIAVKVKNRQINQLSAQASRYVWDWDGTGWNTYTTTSNPAPHVRDILTGDLNADPVPADLIDDASIVAWRTRCDAEGLEVNAVLEGATADVALQLCAGTGYARVRQSEVFGVIEDKDRSLESPVQIFSSRNVRNFTVDKPFVRRPSGLMCVYNSRDDDYDERQVIVQDPNGDGGARYEEARYDALVTEAAVIERALFDLNQARLRASTYQFESNAQALKCQRGDMIGVNHPTLKSHMGGAYVRNLLTDDGNDQFTKALLHFDNAVSLDTTDSNSGGSAHVWTASGDADTGTAKFGTAGAGFSGIATNSGVTTPDHADFTLGSQDWTIDFWFRCIAGSGNTILLCGQSDAAFTNANGSIRFRRSTANVIDFRVCQGAVATVVTGTTQFTNAINTGYHHCAAVRTGDVLKLFIDGVQEGGDVAFSGSINDSSQKWGIGNQGDGVGNGTTIQDWSGQIDEFRLSVGVARWTSNFTPFTAAYETDLLVTGLELDGSVPISGLIVLLSDEAIDWYGDSPASFVEGQLGAVIRLHDGNGELAAEVDPDRTDDDGTRSLTFVTPFAVPAGLDRDCLVVVGELGEAYERMILADIIPKAGPGYPCELTCVDEAPELWS